jgi:hypothetical protein
MGDKAELQQPTANTPSWMDVLKYGVTNAIDGWVDSEYRRPEAVAPTPNPDRQPVQQTGMQIKTEYLIYGALGLAAVAVVVGLSK